MFKEKEYLGKLDNRKEVEKLLEQYILRFGRDPKDEPELSRFHLFDAKGNVKGVRDMEIVDYLVENVQFFVVGITPYYYEHGVFMEDHDGVRMKYRIQKLIYRDQVQSGVIKRIYNLLITQPKVHREAYELNKQPVRIFHAKQWRTQIPSKHKGYSDFLSQQLQRWDFTRYRYDFIYRVKFSRYKYISKVSDLLTP